MSNEKPINKCKDQLEKEIKYIDEVMKILVTSLIVAEENRGKSVDAMEGLYAYYNKLQEEKDG